VLRSPTAPGRPGARAGASVRVAFHSKHSVNVPRVVFSGLKPSLCAPLPTLHQNPHGFQRMTRGQCGSLDLHWQRLALFTPRVSRRTRCHGNRVGSQRRIGCWHGSALPTRDRAQPQADRRRRGAAARRAFRAVHRRQAKVPRSDLRQAAVRYKAISMRIREIFAAYTPIIEPLALDEAYLGVTENLKGIPCATQIAEEIRARIRAEIELTASAGVSLQQVSCQTRLRSPQAGRAFCDHPENGAVLVETSPVRKFHGIGRRRPRSVSRPGSILRARRRGFLQHHFGTAVKTLFPF
jgi:impB/mucB/samB family